MGIMYDVIQFMIMAASMLLVFLLIYYKNAFNHWQRLGVPYLKPSFPLGNFESQFSKYLAQRVSDIYEEMKKRGSKFCGYYMFAMPVFLPISVDMVKLVLTKNFESFEDRGFHSDEKHDPMCTSIITTTGEKWRKMRTVMSPTFTSGKIKAMFPIIAECGNDLENVLEEATRKSEPIAIYDLAGCYATDVICSVAFGLEGNSLKDPNSEFRNYGRMVFRHDLFNNIRLALGTAAPALLKIFRITLFSSTATKFFQKVVKDTIAYRESNKVHRKDLIDMLIRLKNNEDIHDDVYTSVDKYEKMTQAKSVDLTVDQIAAHCFSFFIAGFETAATTINFCMFELAVNPDIQDKVRAEVVSVWKKYNGHMTYDGVSELRYLEKVILETLRKHPTVHTLNRLCTKDLSIPETNITIKKGTRAAVSVLGIHKDPEFYPDPEKFDPERFTDEEKAKRHSCAYIPFGDGPRICPGMKFGLIETKICISRMIRNYKFSLHPKVKLPLQQCTLGPVITTDEPILLLTEKI